jgi:hypothetical protein
LINGSERDTHIFLVRHVLNEELRKEFIEVTKSITWRKTASTADRTPTRSVGSIQIQAGALDAAFDGIFPPDIDGQGFVGLSYERVFVAQYQPGDSFQVHSDGVYVRDPGVSSIFSVLIYLNGDFEGGETNFPDLKRVITPEAGAALIFGHAHRHAGQPIASGVKYALHLFALYSGPSNQLNPAKSITEKP